MELIDGWPLDQYVSRHHLSRTGILRLFERVCCGVQHAHERGVIHRDLKPGNILVTADGEPHVLDFGLAKAMLEAGKEAGVSIDGEVAGTPGFMSPEQAAGKLNMDARCDVYSLGVILYRLLTGGTPHEMSGTYLDILRRVSDEEPRRPRLADPTMDRELEALILRAIQRDPAARYKTAGELANDVACFLSGDPIAAKTPTTLYFLRKRAHKHRVKLITAAIVVLLVALAAILAQRSIRSHRSALLANAGTFVSDGDAALLASKWPEARKNYLSAMDSFKEAGASPMPALLGLWDLSRTAPAPLLTIPLPHAANGGGSIPISAAPVFLSGNRRALLGYDDGTLRVYDLSSSQLVLTIAAHDHPVRSVGISTDGSLAITGSDDGSMKLWDLAADKLKLDFRDASKPLKNWVTHVAISPDRRYALSISGVSPATMLSSNYDDTLTLWDAQTGRQVLATDNSSATARRSPRPPSPPTAGPFSPAAKTAPPGCGKPVPATSSQPCADTRPPSTRRPFPMTCTGPSPAPAIPKTPAATSLWNFKLAGPN